MFHLVKRLIRSDVAIYLPTALRGRSAVWRKLWLLKRGKKHSPPRNWYWMVFMNFSNVARGTPSFFPPYSLFFLFSFKRPPKCKMFLFSLYVYCILLSQIKRMHVLNWLLTSRWKYQMPFSDQKLNEFYFYIYV